MRNIDYSYLIGNQFAKGNKPNKTAFAKGHIPWNKGKKGIHLSPKSEFKKGRESNKKLPTGTITKRREAKTGLIRRWIKISEPNVWVEYAKYRWSKWHGPIPKGMIIHHKNKNCLDDRITNLEIVTRSEHIKKHKEDLLKAKRQIKESIRRKTRKFYYSEVV